MDKKIVNQKEYLKKYLSSGKDKKKVKKKKPNLGTKTVKIIDDDIDLKNMRAFEDGELDIYNNTEDGPQIAGIIDERGPVDFSDKKRWKIVTDDWDGDITVTRVNRDGRIVDEESSPRNDKPDSESRDEDFSPPRRPRNNSDSDDASRRKTSKKRRSKASSPGQNPSDPQDSDFSPPRKSRKGSDSDEQPRKKSSSKKRRSKPENRSDPEDSDLSPPRKARKDSDSDLSPPRNSKPRRKEREGRYDSSSRKKDKSKHSQRREDSRGSRRDYKDYRDTRDRSSVSLAPRGRNESYKAGKQSGRNDSNDRDDRRNNRARQDRKKVSRWKDRSPSPRNRGKDDGDSDLSPPRENRRNQRNLESEPRPAQKSTSTNYQEMSEETTGFGQAPVYRDRKTGRRRDFAAEAREQGEKYEKRQELEEKYAQWGRGLKQVEDRQEKLDRDLYEMSKPLARYADDADLERELKAQDREGDPMLAYMKRKQVKEGKKEPEMPQYKGPSMPNRFGIRPGYRWDGVDRSNGYEKKWFEAQNARKAVQEEAYKWSTADM